MCGIVAVINKGNHGFNKKQEDVFYDLLFVDTLRGDDSTGVIFTYNNGDFGIMKDAWAAPNVIQDFQSSDMGKSLFSKGKVAIGHNRKATVGKVEKETAHPFVVDKKFALVHNGTLYNHKDLADTKVDSEALAIHLAPVLGKDFDLAAFEEAIGKVNGAYACITYNQETNCVYVFRNKERPLSIFETADGWVLGSEFGMVGWCVTRNSITVSKDGAQWVKENTLYTFDLNKNTCTMQEYVPKKARPPITVATYTEMAITAAGNNSAWMGQSISKNYFKTLKRKHLGRKMQFYADDYVEKYFPNTIEQGETLVTLMGENDYLSVDHYINASFDITDLPVGDTGLTDRLYIGEVHDMVLDKANERIVLFMHNCKPVPKVVIQNETAPAVH